MTTYSRCLPRLAVCVSLILVTGLETAVDAQCEPYCQGNSGLRIRRSHSGRITLQFPRYSLYVNQSPRHVNDLVSGRGGGTSIVFKSETGMRWNGAGFFNHPSYRNELVTSRYYAHQYNVGEMSAAPATVLGHSPGQHTAAPTLPTTITSQPVVTSIPTQTVGGVGTSGVAAQETASYQFVVPPWVVHEHTPILQQPANLPKISVPVQHVSPGASAHSNPGPAVGASRPSSGIQAQSTLCLVIPSDPRCQSNSTVSATRAKQP